MGFTAAWATDVTSVPRICCKHGSHAEAPSLDSFLGMLDGSLEGKTVLPVSLDTDAPRVSP